MSTDNAGRRIVSSGHIADDVDAISNCEAFAAESRVPSPRTRCEAPALEHGRETPPINSGDHCRNCLLVLGPDLAPGAGFGPAWTHAHVVFVEVLMLARHGLSVRRGDEWNPWLTRD